MQPGHTFSARCCSSFSNAINITSRATRRRSLGVGKGEASSFDTVIFNHPHLGKEDFKAHARFLAHFFQSVKTIVEEKGRVCLTFAGGGQADRWKAEDMARRCGFGLKDRREFVPPPVDRNVFKDEGGAYTTWRRGHSGRGFKGGQSECLIFALDSDGGDGDAYALPWMVNREGCKAPGTLVTGGYKCLECHKVFPEERSLVNHLKDSTKCGLCYQPNNATATPAIITAVFTCKLCERSFVNEAALKEHGVQRHTGFHKSDSLKPDWFYGSVSSGGGAGVGEEGEGEDVGLGRCEICGVAYREGER